MYDNMLARRLRHLQHCRGDDHRQLAGGQDENKGIQHIAIAVDDLDGIAQ